MQGEKSPVPHDTAVSTQKGSPDGPTSKGEIRRAAESRSRVRASGFNSAQLVYYSQHGERVLGTGSGGDSFQVHRLVHGLVFVYGVMDKLNIPVEVAKRR